jgi:hypothetical protein
MASWAVHTLSTKVDWLCALEHIHLPGLGVGEGARLAPCLNSVILSSHRLWEVKARVDMREVMASATAAGGS